MKYGYFDPQAREYVISNPCTPVKWINYIGTRAFGGFVDQTGGALLCKDDPAFNRVTKYLQQNPSGEFKGETLYLRLHTLEGYRLLSPFFVPGLQPLDKYECHVGLDYTRILSEIAGLRTEALIFVPRGAQTEIRRINVTNIADVPMNVDAIPLVEFSHPDALNQLTNADWTPQTMQCRAQKDGEFTLLVEYPFMTRDTRVNYLTSNLPASSFESDRKQFLGGNEYATYANPLSLQEAELGCHQARRGDIVGALLHPLGKLQPGESRTLIIQLGQAASIQAAAADITRFRREEVIQQELDKIAAYWEAYLAAQQVETPEESMNLMLNLFNPRQCSVTKNWSRYLSYYQLGLGARGIGMRDSAQDCLGVTANAPEEAAEMIRLLLSFQNPNGACMHQFNPLTLIGSQGDSLEMEDRPHYYSDDHLWLVPAVCAYLKESGNLAFLDEEIPFYDPKRPGEGREPAAVLEHLRRGLDFTAGDLGSQGLPLLGFADWNDTVNLPRGAESLFSANLYGLALREMTALLEFLGKTQEAQEYRDDYEAMRARVEACAWDGDWYVSYFDEQGEPVGSARNQYGKINLNGQTWPVLSGFATPERARRAMDAVYEKLNTKYGIKLSWPGFNGYDRRYGGVTTYPPGAKENGGIFVHPNPWACMAEALLGNGERAYQYYAQVNPAARNDSIEVYECEPYVYAQNILGDEHPQFGLGRNSWLSGSAAWNYVAGTQYILGIRPEYDGLRVDPCIPSAWDGFSMRRCFRGAHYDIRVHNPAHVCRGVARMNLDGRDVPGSLIPLEAGGGNHVVEVWMGS